jgi:hypothetical protein
MNPSLNTQASKPILTTPATAAGEPAPTVGVTRRGPSAHQSSAAGTSSVPSPDRANGNGTPPRNASLEATVKPYGMPSDMKLKEIATRRGFSVDDVRETYDATLDAGKSVRGFSWEKLDAQLDEGRKNLAAEAAQTQAKNGGVELGASSGQPGSASTKPVP